jgi:filamentous hemagglutinin family protein
MEQAMCRIYHFAWNKRQASSAPESTHPCGKQTKRPLLRRLVLALALASPAYALALPGAGQISAGIGNISQSATTLTITQTTPNLAINWQSFNIGQNETVNFNQPGSSAIALNRVLGQDPSQILGNLNANGQVFVLNPNGVLFGSAAQVNVGGLVASTLSLSDADFLAGNHTFSNRGSAGSVVNYGTLTATDKGYIALLAPEARNEGVIVAILGTALLASGDKITLNLNNGSLLSYTIDQGTLNGLAENKYLIQADGGQVILSARAADALTSSVVNNSGIIEAHTIENQDGVITLLGDMQTGQVTVSGTLDASAPTGGDGGFIETSAAHVAVASGSIITTQAPQGTTGNWLIDPADYTIAAAGGDITGADLAFNLGSTSVTILSSDGTVNPGGNGDIFVNDAVNWNNGNSLTLDAIRNINVNSTINNGGTGAINLSAAAAVAVNANLGSGGAIAITAPAGLTQDIASTITTTGLTVNVGAASIADGIIDGAGGLTKTGAGTLTLSNVNTYAGATTINAGTLSLSGDGNLGAVPGSPTPGNLILNGGTLQATSDIQMDANRGISLSGAGTFNTSPGATLTIFGNIAGVGTLTKAGTGTLTLAASNSYTGATTINAGTLLISNDSGLGTAPGAATAGHLTLNGGALEIQYIGTVPLHANRGIALGPGGGSINTASSNTTTYAGTIAGSGAFNKGLGGTLELSGTNSYTGLTTVSGGTLRLAGGAAIADTGAVNLGTSGAILRLFANETIGSLAGIAGTSIILQNNSTLTTGDAGNTDFAGVMSGAGGNLFKQGGGTFTLSGANSYTGLTTVNAGTLAYGITNALDAGAVTVNGGTLDIGSYSDTVGAVTLNSGAISGTTGVLTGTGYDVQSGTISARLGGAGALTKSTGNTVTLSGANSYTGATTISAGKLSAADADALGTTAGTTTVAEGATLEIANVAIGNETITLNGSGIGETGVLTGTGTASLAGPVTLATDSTLGATNGNSLELSGTIEGASALDVLGGGTVTLGGTVGSSTALASLSGAAGTALTVNGGLVRTSGAQTYSGATTFGATTTLRTTAGGNISAAGAVTATAGTLTLDTGAGDATFTNTSNDFGTVAATSTHNVSLVDANALGIGPINATGLVDIRSQSGDLTLNNAITTTSTSANAVTLIADGAATPDATGSGGNFKNAGSAAITTGAGGAWRIHTGNPTDTNRGGLVEAGKRYNVDDGSDPIASGNRMYFRIQPILTLTADNKIKTYGAANPAFTYSYSGLIDSDLINAAISSGPGYTVDGTTSTSGQLTAATLHNITPSAATAANLGYSLSYASGTLTVNKRALTIAATGTNKVYDTDATATVNYWDNRVAGDLLTITGTASYLDKNVGIGKAVNVSGITLGNTDASNYTFNTTTATVADITARALKIAANYATKEYTGVAFQGGNGVTYTGFVNGESSTVLGGTLAYSGTSQGAINPGRYLITPGGLTADNYSITYLNGVLTINPTTDAGGLPPLLVGAVLALPGGEDLFPAFISARVATIAPVTPVTVPSGTSLQPVVPRTSLKPSDSMSTTDTVEQVGNLTLMNGGVKLPADTKSPDGE